MQALIILIMEEDSNRLQLILILSWFKKKCVQITQKNEQQVDLVALKQMCRLNREKEFCLQKDRDLSLSLKDL